MKTKVIVNPKSAAARTARRWPEIKAHLIRALGEIDSAMTEGRGHAIELAREAIKAGCDRVVAVGGDGTCNEVANGFFEREKLINREAIFSFVMSGTGGDFKKSFDISQDLEQAVCSLADARPRAIDLGKISYTTFDDNTESRYFLNFAGFGFVGCNDHLLNHSRFFKALGGGVFTFMGSGIYSLLTYRNQPITIIIDDQAPMALNIVMAFLFNGRFGGGMKWAPSAELDDGLLDVSIIGDLSKTRCLLNIPKCYSGDYINEEGVTYQKAARVEAASEQEVLITIDGESIGKLPATFEVVPGALKICC